MANFQKIIDKISDAFSILDFSYIISGGFTFLLLLFGLHKHHESFMMEGITITIICGVFLSYICGLFSWVIGKNLRRFISWCFRNSLEKDFNNVYTSTLNSINDACHSQFPLVKDSMLEYEYMWICLGKVEKATERINYIHRFWVMQAVYEGLIGSLLLALAVLVDVWCMDKVSFLEPFYLILLVLILLLVYLCMMEARRCARTQISEVIFAYYIYILKER